MSKNTTALVDIQLAKKMEEYVTHNAKLAIKGKQKVINYLNKFTGKSKTAFYYLGILEDQFTDNNFNSKSLEYFRLGKGDLFCDYMLFKNEYMSSSLSVPIGNMMINLSPLQNKLQYLSKQGSAEATYLLADCVSLPIMGIENVQAGLKFKDGLAKCGHRAAEYDIAKYMLAGGVTKKNINTIHGYLVDSSNKDYIPATKLLLECYLDGVLPYRSKKEIIILEERLAYRSSEYALDAAKRYIYGYNNTKINYTKALEYLNIAYKLGADCTKLYALVYYFSYLGLKEHKRSYVVTLEAAVKYLKEVAPTGDTECLTYLGDIYYSEDSMKNLEYAKKYYDFVFKTKPSKELALKLFYIYYQEKDTINRDPKLYEYSYYLYRIGFYEDPICFKTFYHFIKPVNDIQTLASILEKVKDIYHEFYLKERSILYFRVQDPQNGVELYNMIDKSTLKEDDYVEFATYMDLTAKTAEHMKAAVEVYDILAKEYRHADCALRIGAYYLSGDRLIDKNIDLAKEYLIIASLGGKHEADYHIARICFLNKDYRRGIEWLNTGAAYNDTECECAFADVHFNGEYVAQDLEKAADYYNRAAEKKHPRATYQLGFMLYNGIGFKKDEERGMYFINEASKLGYHASFTMSEEKFKNGLNDEGIELLNKALNEENDLRAADKLGDIYFNGEIVKKNYKKAREYYELGDSFNIANSTYHLGLYFDGTVKKNRPKKALKYFEKAALLGSNDAKAKLALLAFDLKKYDTAYTYLCQSLDDNNPRTYYCLAFIYAKRKVKGLKKEDAKFYAKKAYELGYRKAKRFC